MEEHVIFGTYHTAALRALAYRALRQGLQHRAQLTPRDPLPHAPVTLHVTIAQTLPVVALYAFYTTDGSQPTPESTRMRFTLTQTTWDSLLWRYQQHWEAALPGQPEGTLVRYRIGAELRTGAWVFADWPSAEAVIIAETRRAFGETDVTPVLPPREVGCTFAYTVDTLAPPAWAQEAVIYQIFVDRFAPGAGRAFAPSANLSDFFGGTLRGVIERLDALADLGINTLWLSPLFPSPTHHGYDATDYCDVEPRLGTLADMRELVAAAHARGLRVLLDLALNHCSHEHPFFQAALADPQSDYHAWFKFAAPGSLAYEGYFGVETMPEWNLEHPPVRAYLLDVGRFWLELGVDGFRLDYADGPGPGFWSEFRRACREVNPEAWLFGEIVQPPDVLAPYVGRLDGSLDFLWAEQVRRAVAYGNTDAEQLATFWANHRQTLTTDYLRPVFLDNHDMDRFLLAAGDDKRRLRLGLLLLCIWPQPPILYYGTEIGLRQTGSTRDPGCGLEVSRTPMVWEAAAQDATLRADVQQLLALRRASPALVYGEERWLALDATLWAFTRSAAEARFVVALNLGETARSLALPFPAEPVWTAGEAALAERQVQLGPLSGGIWQAR